MNEARPPCGSGEPPAEHDAGPPVAAGRSGDSLVWTGRAHERRLRRRAVLAVQAVVVALFLATWEWAVATGRLDRFFYSQPSAIAGQLWTWFSSGSVWPHIGMTLLATLLGFAGGTLLGLAVGFILARSDSLGAI